jgi:hypothetical protein
LIRADLVSQDLPRVIAMLNSVLWTMDPSEDGWRRYLALILDGMTATSGRRLCDVPNLRYSPAMTDWPL